MIFFLIPDFFSHWIQSDPLQFTTCNIHSWSIDCYSSGNYLKRESSCAFLMDCACLPLLYMDRELVWRSVILFCQSLPSTLLFGREEYLRSSLHISRVLLGWLGWMTLNPGGDESLWVSTLSFSLGTLSWRKTMTFSHRASHVKYLLFPARNLFTSLIFYVFQPYVLKYIFLQRNLNSQAAFDLFLRFVWQVAMFNAVCQLSPCVH